MGLVDEVTHPIRIAGCGKTGRPQVGKTPAQKTQKESANFVQQILESTPVTRKYCVQTGRKTVQRQTQGNYPSPFKIIDTVQTG
ncbi:MAG: hypothetical protein R3C26_00630 [Calditrichia bacterium]